MFLVHVHPTAIVGRQTKNNDIPVVELVQFARGGALHHGESGHSEPTRTSRVIRSGQGQDVLTTRLLGLNLVSLSLTHCSLFPLAGMLHVDGAYSTASRSSLITGKQVVHDNVRIDCSCVRRDVSSSLTRGPSHPKAAKNEEHFL